MGTVREDESLGRYLSPASALSTLGNADDYDGGSFDSDNVPTRLNI